MQRNHLKKTNCYKKNTRTIQTISKTRGLFSSISIHNKKELNPLLELGFSKEKVMDLLHVYYNNILDCRILMRDLNGKKEIVLLLGEDHHQDINTYKTGLKLLHHYSLIGLESSVVEIYQNYPIIFKENFRLFHMAFNRGYSFLGHDFGKRVNLVYLEDGVNSSSKMIQGEKKVFLMTTLNFILLALNNTDEENHYIKNTSLFLSTLALAYGLIGFAEILYGYISGDSSGTSKEFYNDMRERDEIMSKNITSTLKTKNASQMAAVMGTEHLYGVSRFLKKAGFQDITQKIEIQYETFKEQKEQGIDTIDPNKIHWFEGGFYPEDQHEAINSRLRLEVI